MNVMKKRTLALMLSAALCVGLLAGCGSNGTTSTPTSTPAASSTPVQSQTTTLSGTVNTDGSTSMESVVKALAEAFMEQNPDVTVNYSGTGSGTGIQAAIDGTLQYADNMTDTDTGVTFRDLLHKYSEGHPWSRFGMDLCMGSKADQPINRRLMMFVPFYVQDFFNTARIVDNEGQARPLVSSEEKIVVTGLTDADHRSGGITPMQSALLLFVLVAAATIYGIRRGKTLWGLDLILFFCAGIAGCILAFLALFSQHPAVSPNYLLFVFHPLHLFCLPWMINKVRKQQKSWYMRTNCAVLTLFILLWAIIPQRIDLAVLPLALCLLVRSASNLILTLKKR